MDFVDKFVFFPCVDVLYRLTQVRNICATIQLVVVARQDTIAKLERAADYLDSVWLRCRVSFIVLRFMYFVLGLVLELVISNLLLELHLAQMSSEPDLVYTRKKKTSYLAVGTY